MIAGRSVPETQTCLPTKPTKKLSNLELLADAADLGLALGWQQGGVDVGQHST
jgi:hypothetical protein